MWSDFMFVLDIGYFREPRTDHNPKVVGRGGISDKIRGVGGRISENYPILLFVKTKYRMGLNSFQ